MIILSRALTSSFSMSFFFHFVFLLVKFVGVGQKGTRGKRQGMLEIGGQQTRPEAEAIWERKTERGEDSERTSFGDNLLSSWCAKSCRLILGSVFVFTVWIECAEKETDRYVRLVHSSEVGPQIRTCHIGSRGGREGDLERGIKKNRRTW